MLSYFFSLKCFHGHLCQTSFFENHKGNTFVVIHYGVMSPLLKPAFPVITRFVLNKCHFTFHKCLAQMSVSKTTTLFNSKFPSNDVKLNLNFFPSQIISR